MADQISESSFEAGKRYSSRNDKVSKKSSFFFVGPPGAERVRLRPRKSITNVCGMIHERCGPPPARTTHSRGVWSVMASLSSVDEPPDSNESKKQCEGQVTLFLVAKPLGLAQLLRLVWRSRLARPSSRGLPRHSEHSQSVPFGPGAVHNAQKSSHTHKLYIREVLGTLRAPRAALRKKD